MTSNRDQFTAVLSRLLQKGLLTASVTTAGSYLLSPSGAFLGPAALSLMEYFDTYGTRVNPFVSKIIKNPIVFFIFGIITDPVITTSLLEFIRKVAAFIKGLLDHYSERLHSKMIMQPVAL